MIIYRDCTPKPSRVVNGDCLSGGDGVRPCYGAETRYGYNQMQAFESNEGVLNFLRFIHESLVSEKHKCLEGEITKQTFNMFNS
jgi:hypothetical protein